MVLSLIPCSFNAFFHKLTVKSPSHILIIVLPIFMMIIIFIFVKGILLYEMIVFIPFIILVIITAILHKKDCEKCKMRFICPGSAAKK